MTLDPSVAAHYYDEAGGVLALAAHALICAVLTSRSLPTPPRPYEIRDAALAITYALDLDAPVPLMQDLAADCEAAGLAVFQ